MILKSILAGTFKLDGGAMFGVVPKKIWNKLLPADENNLCTWALRCLYIESGPHKILVDTGMGNKQDAKFFNHYEPSGEILITKALHAQGIDVTEITDVLLTHLHFDHVGGALTRTDDGIDFTFPKANYWVHPDQWNSALQPNAREKASFLKENILPLQSRLRFIPDTPATFYFIDWKIVYGHTQAMALPVIKVNPQKRLMFAADLFPSIHHLPLPYVMAYDMHPLKTLEEKQTILNWCLENGVDLFLEHDLNHEVATVKKDESHKISVDQTMTLAKWMTS